MAVRRNPYYSIVTCPFESTSGTGRSSPGIQKDRIVQISPPTRLCRKAQQRYIVLHGHPTTEAEAISRCRLLSRRRKRPEHPDDPNKHKQHKPKIIKHIYKDRPNDASDTSTYHTLMTLNILQITSMGTGARGVYTRPHYLLLCVL
jgi:hypothetical protein